MQLVHNMRTVSLHGFDAHGEIGGYFLIALSCRQESEHFALAFGQFARFRVRYYRVRPRSRRGRRREK